MCYITATPEVKPPELVQHQKELIEHKNPVSPFLQAEETKKESDLSTPKSNSNVDISAISPRLDRAKYTDIMTPIRKLRQTKPALFKVTKKSNFLPLEIYDPLIDEEDPIKILNDYRVKNQCN